MINFDCVIGWVKMILSDKKSSYQALHFTQESKAANSFLKALKPPTSSMTQRPISLPLHFLCPPCSATMKVPHTAGPRSLVAAVTIKRSHTFKAFYAVRASPSSSLLYSHTYSRLFAAFGHPRFLSQMIHPFQKMCVRVMSPAQLLPHTYKYQGFYLINSASKSIVKGHSVVPSILWPSPSK